MKTFKINDKYQIGCEYVRTRNGFKHTANLYRTGLSGTTTSIAETKVCYLNRTWESFDYESVLYKILDKIKILTPEEKAEFFARESGANKKEVNAKFGMISGIMALGSILTDNQKEANDWKARMLKAGLGKSGLIMPEDWDTLTEDEKAKRLANVEKQLNHAI